MNKRLFSWLWLVLISGAVLLTADTAHNARAQDAQSEAVTPVAPQSPIATPLK